MNIKIIYPTEEGNVTEVITQADAIRQTIENGFDYESSQDALDDFMCDPCTEYTDDPVGKSIEPYERSK